MKPEPMSPMPVVFIGALRYPLTTSTTLTTEARRGHGEHGEEQKTTSRPEDYHGFSLFCFSVCSSVSSVPAVVNVHALDLNRPALPSRLDRCIRQHQCATSVLSGHRHGLAIQHRRHERIQLAPVRLRRNARERSSATARVLPWSSASNRRSVVARRLSFTSMPAEPNTSSRWS